MGVGDGVVDKEGKASPARTRARPVSADERVGRKRTGFGGGGEFCFLDGGYENRVFVKESGEFGGAVLEAVAIELDKGIVSMRMRRGRRKRRGRRRRRRRGRRRRKRRRTGRRPRRRRRRNIPSRRVRRETRRQAGRTYPVRRVVRCSLE